MNTDSLVCQVRKKNNFKTAAVKKRQNCKVKSSQSYTDYFCHY